MFKGYFLDVMIDLFKELENKPTQSKVEETKKEDIVNFSTDIQDVQDFCFKEGMIGNCNEKCANFNSDFCELKEV